MRLKTILGIAGVVIFGALVITSFGSQVTGYETFTEAEASGHRVHVVGNWMRNRPATYNPTENVFQFTMSDEEGTVREVVYPNPKPANFEDAEQVVVEGRMTGEVFSAERILVKCPSKYNDGSEFEGGAPRRVRQQAPGPASG